MSGDDFRQSEEMKVKGQQTESVVKEFFRAIREKDIDAAVSLFAEDAEIDFGAGWYPGHQWIRKFVEDLAERASVYMAAHGWDYADLASTRGETHFRIWSTRNMQWFGTMTFIVHDSKIRTLTGVTYSKENGPSEYVTSLLEPDWPKNEWQK